MNFKVGDEVKVIARKHGHHFYIGEIVKIIRISSTDYTCESFDKHNVWWLKDDEVAKVKFTKSDLKNGDIVTYRSGDKRTVVAGNLINSSGYISKKLNQYTNELKDTVAGKNLDIIKVERPSEYETVFERKEEILDKTEKRYLANVIRPFRHEIETIEKTTKVGGDSSLCYLNILLKNNDMANLPDFKKNSMYEGMEVNKKYTLKELGL